jgi:hypothetical protein
MRISRGGSAARSVFVFTAIPGSITIPAKRSTWFRDRQRRENPEDIRGQLL